jgi:hypothetical protein
MNGSVTCGASVRFRNGDVCEIPTGEASGECTHPSVLDAVQILGKDWNGYRYWMAFTPYPGNDERRFRLENPSIVASHDGEHWQEPEGVRNPLVRPPGPIDLIRTLRAVKLSRHLPRYLRGTILGIGYNADPALQLSRDGIMSLAYVHSLKGGSHDELLVIKSADGWRSIRGPAILLRTEWEESTFEINVPSIVETTDGQIELYYGYVPFDEARRPRYDRTGIRRRSGPSLHHLGPPVELHVASPSSLRLWHHELRAHPEGRIICFATFAPNAGSPFAMTWPPHLSLYYGEVKAGCTLDFDDLPVLEASPGNWDSQCIYKPSFLARSDENGTMIHLWYSGQNAQTREWKIGYTRASVPRTVSASDGRQPQSEEFLGQLAQSYPKR